MYDLDSTLRSFYEKKVAISKETRDKLRDARKENERQLIENLAKAGKPTVKRHVRQGGYAMKTVVQQPGNAYDIDNGAVFTYQSLLGPNDGEMSPLDARKIVFDALKSFSVNKEAELQNNCVRIYYNGGWWVDVPVYRERIEEFTNRPYLEIASASVWKESDPEGVTAWFQDLEVNCSPDAAEDGDPQFRRIVSYIKALAVSRTSWNWPNGFMISILAETCYQPSSRDDVSLRRTLEAMYSALLIETPIWHPKIQGERLDNKGNPDLRCVEMHKELEMLLQGLEVLDASNCDVEAASKAWDKFFRTTFFKDQLGGERELARTLAFASSPTPRRVERGGDGGRYG